MGRIAVSLLVRLLERHKLDALHVELATELVVRGSTAPPAQVRPGRPAGFHWNWERDQSCVRFPRLLSTR